MISIEKLINSIDELMALAVERNKTAAVNILEETKRRLIDNKFTLVVLGEFKRGKSTFINALLGEKLLPSAVIPLTAIPTVLEYSLNVEGVVLFKDGSQKNIRCEELADYVTERKNPHNIKNANRVNLYIPSDFLKNGIILVDTPGVGSLHSHNTAAAYEYLPQSDAGVFVISVDAPLSLVEMEYLHDVMAYVNELFFIINKIDLVGEEDIKEVLELTRKSLKEKLEIVDPKVFPLSALKALEGKLDKNSKQVACSGIIEFEDALSSFIQNGKIKLIKEASAAKVTRIADELKIELLLWRKGMEEPQEQLRAKIELFKQELNLLGREKEEYIYLLYRETDMLGQMVREDIDEFKTASYKSLGDELKSFIRKSVEKKSIPEVAREVDDFLTRSVKDSLVRWRGRERQKVEEKFEAVSNRFFDRIESIVDKTLELSTRVFDVEVSRRQVRDYIVGDRRFYFKLREDPSLIPDLEKMRITSLLPKSLLLGYFIDKSMVKLYEMLDRNCGRIRYDLEYGIKEGVREVAGQLRQRVDSLAEGLKTSLEQAIVQRQAGEEEKSRAMVKWQKDFDVISNVLKKIQ